VLAALTALLHAAAAYLRLKVLLIPSKIQDEIEDIEDDINALRDSGSPADQSHADRLRQRLARRRGLAATVSSASAPPPSGQPVETRDGTYTPQSDELWHSDARYRQIEAEVINATAALAAKQAEGTR